MKYTLKPKRLLIATILLISTTSFAQMAKQDSIWLPMKYFVGEWIGKSEGQPGKGNYERSYQFILNKKFIEIKNKSTWLPTKENPKGEVHEDIGYISYDKARRKFILRQFHIEGFVNQYILDSISSDRKTFFFVSESIENIPNGWKAKETYHLTDNNEFTETFELAEPNKPFEVYTTAILKRE
jgi:hypothetical protein